MTQMIVLSISAAALATACSSSSQSPAGSSGASSSAGPSATAPVAEASGTASLPPGVKTNITIGYLVDQNSSFYQAIGNTISSLASKGGGKVATESTNDDPATEASAVQTLISLNVGAIVMSPVSETSSINAIKAAQAAGIPVICYNTCLSDSDTRKYVKANVESDNYDLGHQTGIYAASYIRSKLNGKATIGLLNCDQFPTCRQRKQGFEDALKGLDITYAADQTAYAPDTAATVTQDILTAHPNINVMWAVNDGATQGAQSAIGSAGKAGSVVLFGTDINTQIAGYILSGNNILQATTGQDTTAIGTAAYNSAVLAANKMAVTPFDEIIPGSFFARSDLSKVRAYISAGQ